MSSNRRADIQGLRALAVLSVVAFHVRPAWLPGGFAGVDVFFVISGYLITSGLLRDAHAGRVRLTAFWGRRIRRLMPAATLVITVTLLASAVVLPVALRAEYARQATASALSMENWLLAANSVSYLHATALPSPFQHFWSLSVEEQFYVVWPLAVALVAFAAVRLRRSPAFTLGAVAVTLGAASLVYSVASSASSPDIAYFSTFTRAWELLIGASLAVFLPGRHLSVPVARWVFAVGFVLIGASVFVLDSTMAFPGWVAIFPTVGAACMLAAGATPFTSRVRNVFEWSPVTYVGDISYSLYLWHWPLIVLVCAALGTTTVPRLAVVPVVAVAVVGAALTKRFVEDPFLRVGRQRHALPARTRTISRHPFVLGAALLGITAVGVVAVKALPVQTPAYVAAPQLYVGARVLAPDAAPPAADAPPAPTLADLQTIERQLVEPCLTPAVKDTVLSCEGGDPDGTKTILLAGDSHAAMWLPVFEELGKKYGWRIVVSTKQSCPLIALAPDEDLNGPMYPGCRKWNEQIRHFIATLAPDLVLTSGAYYSYADAKPTGAVSYDKFQGRAYERQYAFIQDLGIPVVAVREVPYFPGFSAPDCLSLAGATPDGCSAQMTAARDVLESRITYAVEQGSDIPLIDVTPQICPDDCRAVIGNVVTYRDDNHLTPMFAESLSWVFERDLRESHPKLFPAGSA